ncbi:thiol protease/hemagglutinin PrtT [Saccharicrinis sp. FJH54]|uniref:thiol protease/hemagglutinin PrtT n=1 Tax=Saccharicrinis sp. FJH54 TaxID=3344665 RepID=UPI0035D50EF3
MARNVTPETALSAARNYLEIHSTDIGFKSSEAYKLKPVDIGTAKESYVTKSATTSPPFYTYDINDGSGFIIISGSNSTKPVLGYSFNSKIDPEHIPDAMIELLEQYKEEIDFASKHNAVADIKNEWDRLLNSSVNTKSGVVYPDVVPMIDTKWSQSPYYNNLCPENELGQRAVTGCVATAMAQIMKFHNYPEHGQSFYDYIANNFGQQSVIFANQTYEWSEMPQNLNATSSASEVEAVAKLMYDCGVSVSMNYGITASGSTMNRLANALRNYFGYEQDLRIMHMHNFTYQDWVDSVCNELNNDRPLLYAGFGSSSGHAFIIDGYSNNDGDKFHINWGWGGLNDGYFELTALNPGAYPAGFNYYQHAVFGVQPPLNSEEYNLAMCHGIEFSSDTLYMNSPYNITFNAINNGPDNFNGDIAAFLFDKDSAMIQYSGYQWNKTINAGDSLGDGLVFNNSYLSVPGGNYLLGVFYKTDRTNWMPFKDSEFMNFKEITVIESDSISSLILKDSLQLTPFAPVQNDSLGIFIHALNKSEKTFLGKLKIKVFNNWGNFISVIDSSKFIEIKPDSSINLTLKLDSVKLSPGKYFISVFECPVGTVNEYRINPGLYQNPISLIILPEPPKGDRFENNDSIEVSQQLPVEINSNYFYKIFDSLSIHTDSDVDYFKIYLPEGPYRYNINIYTNTSSERDKEGSNNPQYNEGAISLQLFDGNAWTTAFTQQTQSAYPANPGDTIWIKLFPYFTGLTTDYSMTIYISRTVTTESNKNKSGISVYPSLFNSVLYFDTSDKIESIEIYNTNGLLIYTGKSNIKALSTSHWLSGTYIVKTSLNSGIKNICTVVKQ